VTETRAHFDEAQGALIASGVWHAESASALPDLAGKTVRILDGAGVTQLDTNGAWLLLAAARPQASDSLPELRAFRPQHLVPNAEALRVSNLALREWTAGLWYRLRN